MTFSPQSDKQNNTGKDSYTVHTISHTYQRTDPSRGYRV